MSAHVAACRAAYRAGQGTYRLGGAPYDELCGVCSLPLGRDGYQVLDTWFHRECLLPVADLPEEPQTERVYGNARVRVTLEVADGGAEGLSDRLRAALQVALASVSVPGAETVRVEVLPLLMQSEQSLEVVLAGYK